MRRVLRSATVLLIFAVGSGCSPNTSGSNEILAETCSKPKSLDWVTIDGGFFQMGTGPNDSPASPMHQVNVPTYRIARTEILNCQYDACVADGACSAPEQPSNSGLLCYYEGVVQECESEEIRDAPVVYINWQQASDFCNWGGARLCTEAEWEYAARNGNRNDTFPWGSNPFECDLAVVSRGDGCVTNGPERACSRPTGNNKWGVCDLIGNVLEFVEDDWHYSYVGAPNDGSAWIDSPRADKRVVRGSADWDWYGDYDAASVGRYYVEPFDADSRTGARCCQSN